MLAQPQWLDRHTEVGRCSGSALPALAPADMLHLLLGDAGAVLVTPDASWPADDQQDRLCAALERCGIKEWELFKVTLLAFSCQVLIVLNAIWVASCLQVDNSCCEGAPLGIADHAKDAVPVAA